MQGGGEGAESISNSIVPHKIVQECITKKIKDFDLTTISGDKALLFLLPEKSYNYYKLSDFYSELQICKSLQIFNFKMQILLGHMASTTIIWSQSRRFQIFFQHESSNAMTKAYIRSVNFLFFSLQKHTVRKKMLVRCFTNFSKKMTLM